MNFTKYDRKKANVLLKNLRGLSTLFYELVNCVPESVGHVKDAMRNGRELSIGLSLSLQNKPYHKIKEELSNYKDLYGELCRLQLKEMDEHDWYAKNEPYLIQLYKKEINLLLAAIMEILKTGKLSFETKKKLGWERWGETTKSKVNRAWGLFKKVSQNEDSCQSITGEQAVLVFRNTLENLPRLVDLSLYTKAVERLSGLRSLPQINLSEWKVEARNLLARVHIDPKEKVIEVSKKARFKPFEVQLIAYHEVLGHLLLGSALEAAVEEGLISRAYLDGAGSLPYSEGLSIWVEENCPQIGVNVNVRKRSFHRRLRVIALRYVVTHEIYHNKRNLSEIYPELGDYFSLDEIARAALLAYRYARSYVYWEGYLGLSDALSNFQGRFGEIHPFLCAVGRIPICLVTKATRQYLTSHIAGKT